MEENWEKLKKVIKRIAIKNIFIILIIICIVLLLSGFVYFITIDDGTYKEKDWSSVPYGASQYSSGASISGSGTISSSMTAKELWDKMIEEGSRVDLYLNGPEDLLKLMNAELVTQFIDTRPKPDEAINWDTMNDITSKEIQGIIKLKRRDSNGNQYSMIYASPTEFQSYIDEYNNSGSEEAKNNALTHFTLGTTSSGGTSSGSGSTGNGATYYPTLASSNPTELNLTPKNTFSNVRTTVYGAGADENSGYANQTSSGINLVDESGIGRHIVAVHDDYSMANIGDWIYLKSHPELGLFLVADIGDNARRFADPWLDIFDINGNGAASKYGDYNDVVVISKETVEEYMKGSSGSDNGEWCWPTDSTRITSNFGLRNQPKAGATKNHGGIDIGVATGTNVYACDGGTVKEIKTNSTVGKMVVIDHGNGYISKYEHNSEFKVSQGQKVSKGQVIALSGNTGNSTGPHLHFQVELNGQKVNPLDFKYNNGMGNGTSSPSSGVTRDTANESANTNSQYYAVVAIWSNTTDTEVVKNNTTGKVESTDTVKTYNMTTTNINYQDLVSGYTMPFQYLWSMLVITEDKDFVMDLADLVYNSKIDITVHDNLTKTTNVTVDTYTEKKKTNTTAKISINYRDDANQSRKDIQEKNWSDEEYTKYTVTNTHVNETNTLDIAVTEADVWMAKYTTEYTYEVPSSVESTSGGPLENTAEELVDISNEDKYGHAQELMDERKKALNNAKYTINKEKIDNVKTEVYKSNINRNQSISNIVETKKYVASPLKIEEKTDPNSTESNFVTIFLDIDNSKARENILNVTSWLFELLETNKSTENFVDLTKYLLYKATNIDFGFTEFDFNSFYISGFKDINSSLGGIDLLKEYIHYWEHSSPPLTNADGTKYIIEDDGAGHPTVGYGVDIINGGFKQEFIAAGYPITIGGEVDKAFVDALEDREIQECINYIKSMTNGLNLSEYQIYALVSRAYNCGKAGAVATRRGSSNLDFMSSYKAYWKSEDNKFEAKDANADFNHTLYTNYMSEPVTAKGKGYMSGLERRRKSEWILFQTGYMDVLDKWYVERMGGSIIECAKAIHQYMEENGYTYCVYGSNSYEECGKKGKSHGLSRTFEASKSNKNTCCATYVSWVLQEAGYLTESEHNDGADNLTNLLINKGWTVITDINQFQPGDVLTYSSHVEIYAGDGTVYNAGSGNAIRNSSPQSKNISKARALRAPN